jgi:CRISPR-associated protein Cas1
VKKTIYIFSSGELKRKGNTLYFEEEKEKKKYLPVENIQELFIFNEVTINKKLLEFLAQKEIILHFFNHYGYYIGSFYPREYYNSGYMLLKQAEFYLDIEKRINLAKQFVLGALVNMLRVLNYYRTRDIKLDEEIQMIEKLRKKVDEQSDISEFMAIEGNSKEIYYRSFNKIIKDENFYYAGRERRPPRSKMNALISFGNSLLYTYCLCEIYKTHLDPRIGFLHKQILGDFL